MEINQKVTIECPYCGTTVNLPVHPCEQTAGSSTNPPTILENESARYPSPSPQESSHKQGGTHYVLKAESAVVVLESDRENEYRPPVHDSASYSLGVFHQSGPSQSVGVRTSNSGYPLADVDRPKGEID